MAKLKQTATLAVLQNNYGVWCVGPFQFFGVMGFGSTIDPDLLHVTYARSHSYHKYARARVDHVLPDYAPPHKTNLVFGYRTVLSGFVESLGLLNGVRRVSASELVFFLSVIRVSTVR